MSFRMTVTLAGAIAVFVILGGRWWRAHELASQPLQVESKDLDLGELWLQDPIEHKLHVKNTSSKEIRVTSFEANCVCTHISPPTMVLAPEETGVVTATIDIMRIARESPSLDRWPVEVWIVGKSTDPQASPRWLLQGTIRSPLRSLPSPMLPLTMRKIDAPRHVTFKAHLRNGLSLKSISTETPGASCVIKSRSTEDVVIEVALDPAKADGEVLIPVHLCFSDASGNELPRMPWQIQAKVLPSVAAEPAIVLMGVRDSFDTISLKSLCDRRFKVVDLGSCEGIATDLLSGIGYAKQHAVRIVPTPTGNDLGLLSLDIRVLTEGASTSETLRLWIQRPPLSLAEWNVKQLEQAEH